MKKHDYLCDDNNVGATACPCPNEPRNLTAVPRDPPNGGGDNEAAGKFEV